MNRCSKDCLILSDSFWIVILATKAMMDFNNTDTWLVANTSFPILPVITRNRSAIEGYLQRLAHLDDGLYHDFYGLWIALMVINCLIFLVGTFQEPLWYK